MTEKKPEGCSLKDLFCVYVMDMGFLINNTTQISFNRVYWAPRALESASWQLALKPIIYNYNTISHSYTWRGGRRSPAVACWASDHWVASSNPLQGKFHH